MAQFSAPSSLPAGRAVLARAVSATVTPGIMLSAAIQARSAFEWSVINVSAWPASGLWSTGSMLSGAGGRYPSGWISSLGAVNKKPRAGAHGFFKEFKRQV